VTATIVNSVAIIMLAVAGIITNKRISELRDRR
jgi:uncharacterized membrane protein YqgA involved in biofilm formation